MTSSARSGCSAISGFSNSSASRTHDSTITSWTWRCSWGPGTYSHPTRWAEPRIMSSTVFASLNGLELDAITWRASAISMILIGPASSRTLCCISELFNRASAASPGSSTSTTTLPVRIETITASLGHMSIAADTATRNLFRSSSPKQSGSKSSRNSTMPRDELAGTER